MYNVSGEYDLVYMCLESNLSRITCLASKLSCITCLKSELSYIMCLESMISCIRVWRVSCHV
jgi:hypothetical protein